MQRVLLLAWVSNFRADSLKLPPRNARNFRHEAAPSVFPSLRNRLRNDSRLPDFPADFICRRTAENILPPRSGMYGKRRAKQILMTIKNSPQRSRRANVTRRYRLNISQCANNSVAEVESCSLNYFTKNLQDSSATRLLRGDLEGCRSRYEKRFARKPGLICRVKWLIGTFQLIFFAGLLFFLKRAVCISQHADSCRSIK